LSDVLKPNSRRAMEYALQGRTRHDPSCMSISRGSETAYDLLPASGGAPGPPREMYGGRYYWAGASESCEGQRRRSTSRASLPQSPYIAGFYGDPPLQLREDGSYYPPRPQPPSAREKRSVSRRGHSERGVHAHPATFSIFTFGRFSKYFDLLPPIRVALQLPRVAYLYSATPQHFLHARLSACTLLPSRVA
jgi:hypothetical protein